MKIELRDATPDDGDTIAGFNNRIAEETEGRSLDPAIVGPGVARLLADPSKGRYWVAVVDGTIVGQIMVTWEWSDWRNANLWWIQSVYVLPDFRRHGVFTALYRHVEALARQDGDTCGLRLYYEKDNIRARDTYLALGMVDPRYQVMQAILDNSGD